MLRLNVEIAIFFLCVFCFVAFCVLSVCCLVVFCVLSVYLLSVVYLGCGMWFEVMCLCVHSGCRDRNYFYNYQNLVRGSCLPANR